MLLIDTLNRLLGSADYVADIKKGFIQNLCTPSKLAKWVYVLGNIGKVSVPHGHVIHDMMQPDHSVQQEAIFNPRLINKTYRLEPPPSTNANEKQSYDLKISAKDFLAKQRMTARLELRKKEVINETMVKKLAVVTPKG